MDRNQRHLINHIGFAQKRSEHADAEMFTTLMSLAFLVYCLALYAFGA